MLSERRDVCAYDKSSRLGASGTCRFLKLCDLPRPALGPSVVQSVKGVAVSTRIASSRSSQDEMRQNTQGLSLNTCVINVNGFFLPVCQRAYKRHT